MAKLCNDPIGCGKLLSILTRCDLFAGFSTTGSSVTVQRFPFRLWDKVSAAVLTLGNIGLGCNKLLKQKAIILFIRADDIFNRYFFSQYMYGCGGELLNRRIFR